jgi:hypothetical protein
MSVRALLVAVLAAIAVPSVAHAGDVSYSRDGSQLFYIAADNAEQNNVTLRANNATQISITDPVGVGGDTNFCSFPRPTEAVCPAPRETIHVITQAATTRSSTARRTRASSTSGPATTASSPARVGSSTTRFGR